MLHVGAAVSIGDRLFVGGESEFIGIVTFRGGTIRLGDGDTDDVVVGGEFASVLVPMTDDTFDLGSASQQWRNAYFDGTVEADAINNSGVTTATSLSTPIVFIHLQAPHGATTTLLYQLQRRPQHTDIMVQVVVMDIRLMVFKHHYLH